MPDLTDEHIRCLAHAIAHPEEDPKITLREWAIYWLWQRPVDCTRGIRRCWADWWRD